ncbi:hypothetical protein [Pseudonocardia sp. WMMC193]|uniref:hypothetical protein n=1 Tax=Pseudonocardia sp. WMMC193 TaxID=2911965 RepID=UPI001F276E8E|nr:hypothetical protein [Pseudonocardia sp. WMMC193]MCF7551003.1 hypothetical protein [Pseudonocardia sp. WMMC193]
METVTVKTTPSAVLRDAAQVTAKPAGEPWYERIARGIDALGYAIAPKSGDACAGPVVVELPEPDDHDVVEDDEGRRGAVPSWSLHSHVTLAEAVQAWAEGLDFEGDLTDSAEALRDLERDALKVLAAIATHRRAARRTRGGQCDGVHDHVGRVPARCPRCGSHNPKLHPAVQHEGEVHVCPHPWHGPQ